MGLRIVDHYRDQLLSLLPQGRAWSRDPASLMGRMMSGFAAELARVDDRALALLDEADPRTTTEMLTDWERVAGLPDRCTGLAATVADRRAALTSKLAQRGGQSPAYFIQIAASLGFAVAIIEHKSFDVGDEVGGELRSDDWRHVWTIAVSSEPAGGARRGLLECVIQRARPAHTIVLFSY